MVSFLLCELFTEGRSAMQVYEAVKIWLEYHKTNSKEKTLRTYRTILLKFRDEFGERSLEDLTSEEILSFLGRVTDGAKQLTKRSDTPSSPLFSTSSGRISTKTSKIIFI
jgi:Phage integrase, N-terminal SAM-like domain